MFNDENWNLMSFYKSLAWSKRTHPKMHVIWDTVISLYEGFLIAKGLVEEGKIFVFNNIHESSNGLTLNVKLTTQRKKFPSVLEFSVFLPPIQRKTWQIRFFYQQSRNFKHCYEGWLCYYYQSINQENLILKLSTGTRPCPLTCFLFLVGDFFCLHQLLDSYMQINGSRGDEPVVLLKENYNFSITCNSKWWGETNSTEPPGESLCLKAQQGWYYWLLNHLCLWWNPAEISFHIYVYNLILSCHSTISYGVAVHAIYVSSPTHQCVFCHWVSMLYYPLSKCFDKLFYFFHSCNT